jgi:hypothetical protein
MLNQIVYLRGCFIAAQRWGLPPGKAHPLDAHLGRHVVTRVTGRTLELTPLHTGGEPIRVPAAAVWRPSEEADEYQTDERSVGV